jgi:putative hydrolase of the HAD superfamily
VKYRAVIFDLFGTLVDELRYPERQEKKYQRLLSDTVAILGLPIDGFRRVWSETSRARNIGEIRTTRAALAFVSHSLGVEVTDEQLERAAAIRARYMSHALEPREGALETLRLLRDVGVKVGLVSNTTADVSDIWSASLFEPLMDASILSCDVGMRKPDPEIYLLACERLGVEPRDCLFVGDGSSRELTGASDVGMTAVLLRAPDDTESGAREDWPGTKISSTGDVLELL